jgi:hypothetical protein
MVTGPGSSVADDLAPPMDREAPKNLGMLSSLALLRIEEEPHLRNSTER